MDEGDHERDAATQAFEGVRGELALLRRAIEGIAARDDRPGPPDYSETLAQITKLATGTYQRAELLRKAGEEEAVARQVAARITGAVAEDRQAVKSAAGELRDATRALQGATASARRAEDQKRLVMLAAIGGLVIGMILWAMLAGIVARAVPAGWQWPERMAARTLAMPMWEGGQRMMRAGDAQAFANVTAADRLVIANRSTLAGCAKRADRTGKPVQCPIAVDPASKPGR